MISVAKQIVSTYVGEHLQKSLISYVTAIFLALILGRSLDRVKRSQGLFPVLLMILAHRK